MERGYAQFDWPIVGERGPFDCCWWHSARKLVVTSFCDLVQEDIIAISLLPFNSSRSIGTSRMAESLLCVMAREVPSGVKFPRYLIFVDGC